ncbi:hypothetical protein BJ508DRAFT_364744 [Ascobolus immersus RN42]|uniref:Wax synthase domain-containing protein n=1 Tax=Ascobolus immersus RN42 TaxID=1160509 RepID=A0A3N4HYK8_ASCIM|nr:hypothetical protein BJ508DRAFT_364744 [Ascobolus immersus RN42]
MGYGDLPPSARYRSPAPDNPLSFTWCLLPFILEIGALAFPISRRVVKWVIVPAIFGCYAKLMTMGSESPVAGYGIGTIIAYHALQVLDLLVFSDPQKDEGFVFYPPPYSSSGAPVDPDKADSSSDTDSEEINRQLATTHTEKTDRGIRYSDLPTTLSRLGWATTLAFSPRLLHFRNSPETHRLPASATTRAGFLHYYGLRTLALYILIDYICYYMRIIDPEYSQPIFPTSGSTYSPHLRSNPAPPSWYPTHPPSNAILATWVWSATLYCIRQGTQAGAIFIFLTLAHHLLALTMVALQPVFPGSWTEPSSYVPLFATLRLEEGLPGFWGKSWHGTFKRIFTSPADYFGIGEKSPLRFGLAFLLSGLLHSAGAWTQGRRWRGPLVFFLLQGLGGSAEVMVRNGLKKRGMTVGNSLVLRWVVGVWVVGWLFWTGRWFTDEYRLGGLWTGEPVPWSIWRGGGRGGGRRGGGLGGGGLRGRG